MEMGVGMGKPGSLRSKRRHNFTQSDPYRVASEVCAGDMANMPASIQPLAQNQVEDHGPQMWDVPCACNKYNNGYGAIGSFFLES